MSFTIEDRQYMARAIQLAAKGTYTTDPNPRVGCVLVRDGVIIGEGYHQRAGEGHAEVNALKAAGDAAGATAYVTLEPCSHFGRTPPCSQGLIDAGVTRVVAAMVDPNPEVAGKGISMLKAAGIDAAAGILESEARALNPGFLSRMERGRPFVRLKLATSIDGRTAMASGESQWITGPEARADVQRLRARSSAVITGVGSVLQDDSALTVRDEQLPASVLPLTEGRQPLRVVLDSRGRLPVSAKMLSLPGRTLQVVATNGCESIEGAEQIQMANTQGRIDLPQLLNYLAETESCNEVLVECGAQLAGAMLEAGLVDELVHYMAPKLMGSQARPLAQLALTEMSQAIEMKLKDVRQFGQDLRMIWTV